MARTRQTARKSTGGKAPRGKGGKGLGKGGAKRSFISYTQNSNTGAASSPSSSSSSSTIPNSISLLSTPSFPTISDNNNSNDNKSEQQEPTTLQELLSVEPEFLIETTFNSHYFLPAKSQQQQQQQQQSTGVDILTPRVAYTIAKNFEKSNTVDQLEHFISLDLASKYDGKGIHTHGRQRLALVVALDISGSMSNSFSDDSDLTATSAMSKLQTAKECVLSIMSQLKEDEDSFGLVVFNDTASIIHKLQPWKKSADLEKSLMKLRPGKGTNLWKGLNVASELYKDFKQTESHSSRVFLLTDLEAKEQNDSTNLLKLIGENSTNSLWTSVVGIGVDLTQQLISDISRTNGCNYSNVQSSNGFRDLMKQEFGYLVTPVAFNIGISLKSDRFELSESFGNIEIPRKLNSSSAKISTEFPSFQNDLGEKKPGPLLFKLASKQNNNNNNNSAIDNENQEASFEITYDDLSGVSHTVNIPIKLGGVNINELEKQPGIEKAVLLVQYSNLITNLIEASEKGTMGVDDFQRLKKFAEHFKTKMNDLGDLSLQLELDVLQTSQTLLSFLEPTTTNTNANSTTNETTNDKKRGIEEISLLGDDENDSNKKQKVADVHQNQSANDSTLCCICLENKKNVLTMPCKHVCMCSGCCGKTSVCPLCRTNIDSKTAVFV